MLDVGVNGGIVKEVEEAGANEWEKTSLKPYIDLFRNHCEGIIKEGMVAKRGSSIIPIHFDARFRSLTFVFATDAVNGMEF